MRISDKKLKVFLIEVVKSQIGNVMIDGNDICFYLHIFQLKNKHYTCLQLHHSQSKYVRDIDRREIKKRKTPGSTTYLLPDRPRGKTNCFYRLRQSRFVVEY